MKEEYTYPRCPFTRSVCDIDIFRSMSANPNKHCDTCPDYQANYKKIVMQSIHEAKKNPKSNLHLIQDDIKRDGGKYISFGINDYGLLIGASTTNEDYYWLFLNKDKKIQCSSCVGSYEVLDNIPDNMSIVEYLRNNQAKNLHDIIVSELKTMKHDFLITPIYLKEGHPWKEHYEQKSRGKNNRQKR